MQRRKTRNFHIGYSVMSLIRFQAESNSVIEIARSMSERNTVRQRIRTSLLSGIAYALLPFEFPAELCSVFWFDWYSPLLFLKAETIFSSRLP